MDAENVVIPGYGGCRLVASVQGASSAMPVVLAHGGGQTRHAWKSVAALLSRNGFQTIALDLRGHGDSAWVESGAYDIEDFARDLIAVARTTTSPPALIGASLGGLAGIIAEGRLAPGSFASLTLVDITPQMDPSGVSRIVGFMAAHAQKGFASPEEAARVISEYLPHRPSRNASSRLARYLRQRSDGRYYWHWDPAFIDGITRRRQEISVGENGESELTAAARRLNLPVKLIRGGSSDLVSPEAVTHFQTLVPHAEYSNIADATHMIVGDQNDIFGETIRDFLLRQRNGPSS